MKKIIFSSFIATVLFFSSFSSSFAKVLMVEKGTASIPQSEIINDDLFVGAESIEINGTINGDVYAGGETVRVNGTINGDLHVGAATLYLAGTIKEDVYAGAGNVSVSNATIGDSLIVGAGNINIDKSSTVGGSIISGAGTIAIYSSVKRNLMLAAGTVDLNSTVGGEARMGAGDISIGPDTKIGKDLYYMLDESNGERDINLSESASVSGQIKKVESRYRAEEMEMAREGLRKGMKTFNIFTKIISLLGALIVGFLWLRLFPKSFSKSSELVGQSFFQSLGVGFIITVTALPALIILTLTGVGIPLAGLALLLLLMGLYLSKLVVGWYLGTWIAEKFSWKGWSMFAVFALGITLLYVFKSLPFVGFLVSLITFWSGLGALTLYFKSTFSSK